MASVELLLTCQHSLRFSYSPPKVGESVYCPTCTDMRKVVGGAGDYRANCNNCTSLNVTRRSTDALRRCVVRHLTTCPAHTVTVWRVGDDSTIVVALTEQHLLSGFDAPDTLAYGA